MNATDIFFDRPAFTSPWALRAFGLMLAASEAGAFSLQEFQQVLIAQIRAAETQGPGINSDLQYYTCWTEALTELLKQKGLLQSERLPVAEQAVRAALLALQHDHDHGEAIIPTPVYVEPSR